MDLVVAGIGGRLASDDAIGVALVEALERAPPPGVRPLVWADADALTLCEELLQLDAPVLLVDCADLAASPGSWRLLAPADVRLATGWSSVSSHGFGLAEALELAAGLGLDAPVHLFCVQPFQLCAGQGLSAGMTARVGSLEAALRASIAELLQPSSGPRERGGS